MVRWAAGCLVFVLSSLAAAGCYAPPPTSGPRSSSPDQSDHPITDKGDDKDDADDEDDNGGNDENAPQQTGDTGGPDNRTIDAFPGSKIFRPSSSGQAPGIVMLHGSEGGAEPFIHEFAAEIAKEGFVVVSMCWFGCAQKPARIERIPLESIIDVGTWLSKQSSIVKGGSVGLFGWSRGGEMSLLIGSLISTKPFRAIAVHAPSDTVVAGFDPATQNQSPNFGGITERDPKTGQQIPTPAWTFKGQPLFGEPKADFSVPGPTIAIEKFAGPIYVSQGENDEVWEVARGRRVVSRRKSQSPTLITDSHFFPGEGHVLMQSTNIAARKSDLLAFYRKNL